MRFQIVYKPSKGDEKVVDIKETQLLAFEEADKLAKKLGKDYMGTAPIYYVRPVGS